MEIEANAELEEELKWNAPTPTKGRSPAAGQPRLRSLQTAQRQVVPELDAGKPRAPELDAGTPRLPEQDAGKPRAPELDAGTPRMPELDAGTPRAPAPAPAAANPPFPREGVSATWLAQFADERRGKVFSWTADDFIKPEHASGGVVVDAAGLAAHRERIAAAARDADGVRTAVRYEGIPFEAMTTNDVCFGVVKPATAAGTCSYVDLLLREGEAGAVRDATVFVSHAWKYTFVDVVDTLRDLPDGAHVWFDVFTVNQHQSLQVSPAWWYTTFKDAVASIGHTVLVLMPWNDPIPLTRAWCIWEILCTIDDGAAKLDVRLSTREQGAYADYLVREGVENVVRSMLKLNVERAEAWNKDDQDNILAAVRQYPGGASEVNKRVKDQMRSWLIDSAKVALDGLSSEMRATSMLLMGVANLLFQQGKYDDAEALYREAIEGRRRVLGDAHPSTLDSTNNLAVLLKDLGRYAEAEPLCHVVVAGRRRDLGDAHPQTLNSISNLAVLLSKQGKHAEAEPLYRETLEGKRRELGDAHPDTLGSINNLAGVLRVQGKYAEAEPLFREALAGKRRELGDAHPSTLNSINNLAVLMSNQGKHAEAEPLYRESLEGKRRELGDAHPHTLSSINNLAVLLHKQGRHSDAEALYREALEGRRREFGDAHPATRESVGNLAVLLKELGRDAEVV